jgi:hypothetical protein
MAEDSELPGSGFCTVTVKVPAEEAVPLAVSCEEETKVVIIGKLERRTFAPKTKLLPVMERVKLPRFVEAGEMPVSSGVGFMSVTALVENFEVSAEGVALTVTVLGEGSEDGAVYLPEESMVPRVEEPPAILFTNQVTEVFGVPETVTENAAELPARTLAVEGETATATAGTGGGCLPPELEEALPQAAREKARKRSRAQRAGDGECIDSLFSEGMEEGTTGRRARRGAGGSQREAFRKAWER